MADPKDTKASGWDLTPLTTDAPLNAKNESLSIEAGKAALEADEKNAAGAADLSFFNGTSSEIHIHHANGIIAIPPMKAATVPREIAGPWLKSHVGQAYVDKGLLKTREVGEVDFSSHSDLTPPKSLSIEAATAGSIQATLESRTSEAGNIK